jgi:hypothetical protein
METLDALNLDEWVRMVMKTSGAPEEVVLGTKDVMQIRQGRAAAQQQQAQAAQQAQVMQNWKGLGEAPAPGSPGMALAKGLGFNDPSQSGEQFGSGGGSR